mgnify:CR=1 FL=1
MKVLVTDIPEVADVERQCLFATPTDEYTETSDFIDIRVCRCLFTNHSCEMQLYSECPFLKVAEKDLEEQK